MKEGKGRRRGDEKGREEGRAGGGEREGKSMGGRKRIRTEWEGWKRKARNAQGVSQESTDVD